MAKTALGVILVGGCALFIKVAGLNDFLFLLGLVTTGLGLGGLLMAAMGIFDQ
jgi:hypothetical protein